VGVVVVVVVVVVMVVVVVGVVVMVVEVMVVVGGWVDGGGGGDGSGWWLVVGVMVVVVMVVVVAYVIDVAISNSHSLHGTTKKLRKYSNLKEIIRMWLLNAVCIVPLVLGTTGIVIPRKLGDNSKLLTLRPAVFILKQNEIVLGRVAQSVQRLATG